MYLKTQNVIKVERKFWTVRSRKLIRTTLDCRQFETLFDCPLERLHYVVLNHD